MKNYKYQLIWFLLSIVSFFYVFGVYNNITKLENNKNAIISGIICNKHCKIKGQSTMTVEYKQKNILLIVKEKVVENTIFKIELN